MKRSKEVEAMIARLRPAYPGYSDDQIFELMMSEFEFEKGEYLETL